MVSYPTPQCVQVLVQDDIHWLVGLISDRLTLKPTGRHSGCCHTGGTQVVETRGLWCRGGATNDCLDAFLPWYLGQLC